MDRRAFIVLAAGLAGSAKALRADHHVISSDPLEVESDLASLAGRYTTLEDFYVRNHYRAPEPAGTPVLTIEGEVAKPCRLETSDLNRLASRELGAVLECAGNPVGTRVLASNGDWSGWSFADTLGLAQPAKTASYVHLFGRDGYARSVDLERAMSDGMLATTLNGRPLGRNHGTPWRALFPGWYGMDSVKWLERIVVSTDPLPPVGTAYLEARKADNGQVALQPLPRMQVKSVIVSPVSGSVVNRGKIEVRGLAWTGEGTISGIEVSPDGGVHWNAAFRDAGGRYEWTPWRCLVDLTKAGAVELTCRATDSRGRTQPENREAARLDGYANNWYHRVRCVVV